MRQTTAKPETHPAPGSPWLHQSPISSPSADEQAVDESGLNPKERRREQVRRAQRTHRDRKATYVKALELEVAKLRAKDAHASEDLRQAHIVIQRLQNLLMQYGIPVGPEIFQVDNAMATIELVGRPPFGQSLHAQIPSIPVFDHSIPAPHISTTTPTQRASSTGGGSDVLLATAIDEKPSFGFDAATEASSSAQTIIMHPHGLDSVQVGINFVLALEHPCLYHHSIPSVPMLAHGYMGTGHSLMLSSPIMEHSPSYSLNPLKMGWPRGAKWNVPAIELEKLLTFSEEIELEGEVTPVQVWNVVKRHPKFESMTAEKLEAFRDALLPSVKCLGFGAVIEQGFFETQLETAMGAL
ncbi:uncharacterized protein AB675_7962 [Cyphellophora attinorum]|uniref:BZIP domain-containing protein n=1 Tax=Cyphellophora attinorum TaxID=1664694 RepID=A0A0N1HAT4_9EURO|nr:uncharacterized protein AB675_7962 [Phialophora attinorum]KPI41037.1 hypothetical protein AB675_7962 [Phialophora attinorum]